MSRRSLISAEENLIRSQRRGVPNVRMWSEQETPPQVAWDGYEEEPAFDAGIHVGRWYHSQNRNTWAAALAEAVPGSSILVLTQFMHGLTVTNNNSGMRELDFTCNTGRIFAGKVGSCDPLKIEWSGDTGVGGYAGGGMRLLIFNEVPDGDWKIHTWVERTWGTWCAGGGTPHTCGIRFGNVSAPLRFPVVFGYGYYGGGWFAPVPDYAGLRYLNGNCTLQDSLPDAWSNDPAQFTTRVAPEGTYDHDTIGAVGLYAKSITLYREA
jgi:hypothetical protein